MQSALQLDAIQVRSSILHKTIEYDLLFADIIGDVVILEVLSLRKLSRTMACGHMYRL